MIALSRRGLITIAVTLAAALWAAGSAKTAAQGANPCAAKPANPCANPCAGQPQVDPKLVLRPKGVKPAEGTRAELVEEGKALFKSAKLSTNGMACQSCHTDNANFSASFAKPYPHVVAMVKEAGVKKVQLDEMVQFCMLRPMQAEPLPWDSRELAALTAYSAELQTAFRKHPPKASATGANPCNPCAPRRANPCAPGR